MPVSSIFISVIVAEAGDLRRNERPESRCCVRRDAQLGWEGATHGNESHKPPYALSAAMRPEH
jgi:hypothetical protein